MRKIKLYIVLVVLVVFAARNIAGCQYSLKRITNNISCSFVSGVSYGVGETLVHHHAVSRFASLPPTHFFGSRSWERKYKNYPIDARSKFPGSKTVLVFVTDGYHLSRTIMRASFNLSTVLYKPPRKKWHRVVDFCILQGAFMIGFHLEKMILE